MALQRKQYKVKLPEQLFGLEHVDEGFVDGPFNPDWAEVQPDGSVALLSEGLPRVLRVTKQEGDVIHTSDSGVLRFRTDI